MLLTEVEEKELRSRMLQSHIAYAERYAIHYSKSRAAREAGFSARSSRTIGCNLSEEPDIIKLVDHIIAKGTVKNEITKERVIAEIAKIAFSDIGDLIVFDEDSDVVSIDDLFSHDTAFIKDIKLEHGRIKELKPHDKLKALELLGKHTNIFTDTIDVTSGGEKIASTVTHIIVNHRGKGEELED